MVKSKIVCTFAEKILIQDKMELNESKIFEKFYGKMISHEELKVDGFDKPIPFDIYDGHAVCLDFEGHRYDMVYPMMSAVKETKELQQAILKYCDDITDIDEISAIHSLSAFNTMYVDGVKVEAERSAA